MSIQNIPEVPGVDPASVTAMTRLCSGLDEGSRAIQKPHIFYIGDDPYFCVTDGSTLILLLLEHGLPPKEDVEWDEDVQTSVGRVIEKFGTDYVTYYEDVEIQDILAWCAVGTKECPRCKGTKTCLYPRHNTTASKREDPAIRAAHEGVFYDIFLDRRRLGVTLQILGVDEGTCDVSIYKRPPGDDSPDEPPDMDLVILSGENWRIITAPHGPPGEGEAEREEVPRFPAP